MTTQQQQFISEGNQSLDLDTNQHPVKDVLRDITSLSNILGKHINQQCETSVSVSWLRE